MAYGVLTVRGLDEYRAGVGVIGHYFGWQPSVEDVERFSTLLPPERLYATVNGSDIVARQQERFPFELTVPVDRRSCQPATREDCRRALATPDRRRCGALGEELYVRRAAHA